MCSFTETGNSTRKRCVESEKLRWAFVHFFVKLRCRKKCIYSQEREKEMKQEMQHAWVTYLPL